MTKKQDAQKFLDGWRKREGLDGTRVKPPTEQVPPHLRPYMRLLVKDQKHKLRPEAHDV